MTNLKRLEELSEKLTIEYNKFYDFVYNAPIGISFIGNDNTILYANKKELDIFGYTFDEYVEHNIYEFLVDQSRYNEMIKQILELKSEVQSTQTFLCKNNSHKTVLVTANPKFEDETLIHIRSCTIECIATNGSGEC